MRPLSPADPARVGPHQVLARIGEGGMGEVLLVRTPDDGLAALKVVRDELAHDPEFRSRFAREVRTAQRVRGPHTPAVLSADPEATVPWMATEYVPGPTLREAVRENGPFPEPSLRVLALGLARALQAIHAAGLMHRDLKPGNVLLSPRGPQVIDFGIARAVEGTVLTRAGQSFGTPAYASPEQVVGKGLGPASDVFSLAGVVVFAATGRAPFGAGKAGEILTRVVGGQPELDTAPEALRPLLARCLSKDSAQRPTADEIVHALSADPLPPAEHGWLPAQVNQTIEARRRETGAVAGSAVVPRADSTGSVPGPAPTPPPGERARTALIAGAAALALMTMVGTVSLLATAPWPGDTSEIGEAGSGSEDGLPPEPSEVFGERLLDVKFAPDGQSLYVRGLDHLVEVDWETGEELHRFELRPNDLTVGADGTVVGAFDDAVLLWGPDHGTPSHLEAPDRQGWQRPVLSDDGTRLAVTVENAEETPLVQVWDLETEEVEFELETDSHRRELDFNADSSLLLVSDYTGDGPSAVWDLTTEEAVVEFPNEDFPAVPRGGSDAELHLKHLAFHPEDPALVALATSPEDFGLYDLDTGGFTAFEDPGTNGHLLYEVHFSPDGSRLVASGDAGASARGGRVWDTATGELLTEEGVPLYSLLDFHPQGTAIATIPPGPDDDRLLVVDGETFEVLREFPA